MVLYIMECITPRLTEEGDKTWWMGSTSGELTIKSAFDMLRCKREEEWRANMQGKQIPFKLSFLLWRIWKGRIATEENLKRMGVTIASRCYCCEEFEEETTQHLFLTAPIAQKLWKQFASGIQQHGCLKQMITGWWEANTPIKLQFIFQAIPSIILWELWKRRNARRHGLDINFYKLKSRCVNTIIQLINMKYPWIKVPKNWGEMVPWQQAEEILEIIKLISSTQTKIQHVFREANKLADKLANEAFEQTNAIQIHAFQQLPVECGGIVNMDKAEIPSLGIKTRKITVQAYTTVKKTIVLAMSAYKKFPPAKTKSVKSDTKRLAWNLYVSLKSVWNKDTMEKYGDVLTLFPSNISGLGIRSTAPPKFTTTKDAEVRKEE
ncbi:hypothetical protein RDI58_011104 [Solanum bulbocastanum]|uniref:Reverse transcriptase zinc-binding domain-containing protein n=1 Tax=Solanum bulbocastanum TaxID=147425 RepID=A0AAN8TWH7_SOLBU